jgi:hypothetical protein
MIFWLLLVMTSIVLLVCPVLVNLLLHWVLLSHPGNHLRESPGASMKPPASQSQGFSRAQGLDGPPQVTPAG